MFICMIGLFAMAELMTVTLRLQQLGRNTTEAVRLAQDKVDEITTMNFATAASIQCGGSITSNITNYNDIPLQTDGVTSKGYRRRWLVAAGPDGDLNLRQVTVRVIPDVQDRRISTPYDLVTVVRGVSAPCP
jgi:hypothetical protein